MPHAARHAAEKDTRSWFCVIAQGLKLKCMQLPQEAMFHPVKNREFMPLNSKSQPDH